MRGVLFLLVLLSAYYISAVYRFRPLLALCFAEGVVVLLLYAAAVYLRFRLRVQFPSRTGEAVRGRERACTVRVENPSRLPAARVELRLAARWQWEARGAGLRLNSGAEHGSNPLDVRVRADHCGLLLLRLDRVRVYDALCLFHASRRTGEELRLAVYPEALRLRVRTAGSAWDGGERSAGRPGDEPGEVLNIREYRPGDSLRRVHWNQSARTDSLWMKEFPREEDSRIHVLLDAGNWNGDAGDGSGVRPDGNGGNGKIVRRGDGGNGRTVLREDGGNGRSVRRGDGGNGKKIRPDSGNGWTDPWEADAFYQVLYALALGLLDTVTVVRFHWAEGDGVRSLDVLDEDGARELLLRLYRASAPEYGKPGKSRRSGERRQSGRGMRGKREQEQSGRGKGGKRGQSDGKAGKREAASFRETVERAESGTPPAWTRLLEAVPPQERFLRLTGNLVLYAEDGEAARFTPRGLAAQIRDAVLDL